jgi:glycosyltransferase involved in cell wall biosynthesis
MPAPDARHVVVIHQQDGTDVRVGKVCRTLAGQHRVTYLGWNRDLVETAADLGTSGRVLFVRRGQYGAGTVWVRFAFMWWLVRQLWRLRPDTVVVVNEELALPLVLLRPLLGYRLLIDIHDPLADRVLVPGMRWLLRLIQTFARSGSDRLWVTDEARFARVGLRHRHKTVILPNYPNRPKFGLQDTQTDLSSPQVSIAVLGSLHANRGVDILRQAMERSGDCRVEAAGWIADEVSRSFCELPNVKFHGVVDQQQSLRLMSSCDLVFCFYNPEIPNNRNASPNKVYEAICLGKRCVINEEAQVSQWVLANRFGYVCRYADVAALADILRSVKADLPAHRLPDQRLVEFARSKLYWEVAEPALLGSI